MPTPRSDWMMAVFLLGVLLFNRPLIEIFDRGADAALFGIPLLYLHFFGAWVAMIAVMALVLEWQGRRPLRHRQRGEDGEAG